MSLDVESSLQDLSMLRFFSSYVNKNFLSVTSAADAAGGTHFLLSVSLWVLRNI